MHSFTAIDFETARPDRWSICQIGLVRVENHRIVEELNFLVQPPENYYWGRFTQIHGIAAKDTKNAPTFDKLWPRIEPYIKDQTLVAHNGFSFDFPVLNKTLEFYGLEAPYYDKQCTYRIFKKNLALLSDSYNIELNHHDALSDARACAALFLIYLQGENPF